MKSIIILLIAIQIVILTKGALTQEYVSFTYDVSGNRILREIVLQENKIEPDNFFDTTYLKNSPENIEPEKYTTHIGEIIINIHPNPNGGMFSVEFDGWDDLRTGSLKIHNVTGNLLIEREIDQSKINIDISDQPNGTFILTIFIDGKKDVWKIIKK